MLGPSPSRQLTRLKPSLFRVSYSASPLGQGASQLCQDHTHPKHLQALSKLRNIPPASLQWLVFSVSRAKIRPAVVRNWISRRFERAALEVLRERGLTWNGQLLSPLKGQDETLPLTGTITIALERGMITAKWLKIKEEAAMAVDVAMEACRKNNARPLPTIGQEYDQGNGNFRIDRRIYDKRHGKSKGTNGH